MTRHLTDIISLLEINLKVRYRQTFIGFLWVVLNPIVLFFVQLALFSIILNRPSEAYPLYLLSGLLPWFYISQTAEMGCNYISTNAGLIKNLKIHPIKLIISLSIENFINMLSASLIIFCFILYKSKHIDNLFVLNFLSAGVYSILLISLITFISSLLNVLYKDIKYILHFIFTLLYFSTPTFFYTSSLPADLQYLIKFNPFYWIIATYRLYTDTENIDEIILFNVLIIFILTLVAVMFWKKNKNRIYLKI